MTCSNRPKNEDCCAKCRWKISKERQENLNFDMTQRQISQRFGKYKFLESLRNLAEPMRNCRFFSVEW